jgi:dTDP-4-amino-4,6-dideoxygalactose transaminase
MDCVCSKGRDRFVISFTFPVAQYRAHKRAIDDAVSRVMKSGKYIVDHEVVTFERAFAQYCGCDHAVGVGSGTDALILALRACQISFPAEVITVSHTAIATVAAVLAVGAVPVLVDVDSIYYTMDPATLELAITERTKAIIAVHLYGQAADIETIRLFARRHGLVLIEDCAQAAGGSYKGKRLGSFGDAACFSFYPTKNLGAIGDGGMVVTSNPDIAMHVRRLREYGWDERRQTCDIGVNSRLDEIQAAILSAKLPSLNTDNDRRARLATRYGDGLVGLPITVPRIRDEACHVFNLYVVTCDHRDGLKSHLASAEIGSGIHYPLPVHRHDGYAQRVRLAGKLTVTDRLAGTVLSLPMYPELQEDEVDRIVTTIRSYYSG